MDNINNAIANANAIAFMVAWVIIVLSVTYAVAFRASKKDKVSFWGKDYPVAEFYKLAEAQGRARTEANDRLFEQEVAERALERRIEEYEDRTGLMVRPSVASRH